MQLYHVSIGPPTTWNVDTLTVTGRPSTSEKAGVAVYAITIHTSVGEKIQRRKQFSVQHSARGMMENFKVLQRDESLACLTRIRFWNHSDKKPPLRCRKVKNQKSLFFLVSNRRIFLNFWWDFDSLGTIRNIFTYPGCDRRSQSEKKCWMDPMSSTSSTKWCG